MNNEEMKKALTKHRLLAFAKESDRIEGIIDMEESGAHERRLSMLIDMSEITVGDLVNFNRAGQLRTIHGMSVIVGKHVPPPGGPEVVKSLIIICNAANAAEDPYDVHHQFEQLHPFTDGNGRTGRALWLWQMISQHHYRAELGFLHKWYYQCLEHGRV